MMTPEQLLKSIIIERARADQFEFDGDASAITAENVDELYDELTDQGVHWDYVSELRSGDAETGLPCGLSRHYESKAVAAKAPNGQWIGWTYWFGGGKHGCPEEIDWMDKAYFLNVTERQEVVTVRSFEMSDSPAVQGGSCPALASYPCGSLGEPL